MILGIICICIHWLYGYRYTVSSFVQYVVDTYVINIYLPQISCVRQLINPIYPLSMTDQVLRHIKQLASLYFSILSIFVFLDSITRRQNILDRTIASISWVLSALNFDMRAVFNCYVLSQKSEFCHTRKWFLFLSLRCDVSYVLFTRHEYVLCFHSIYV